MSRIVLVMGVSGSGKSTIAETIATNLGGDYLDADPFHPPENITKMKQGIPLTDDDRKGWLQAIRTELERRSALGKCTVLACSALKKVYRDVLLAREAGRTPARTYLVYLKGSFEVLEERMKQRSHFMPPTLLRSQLDTLEEPSQEESAIVLDITLPIEQVALAVITAIQQREAVGQ